jgi:hypothetical protein
MNRIAYSLLMAATLSLTIVFTGCDTVQDESAPRIRILMTDAPLAQMDSALVSIDRVEIKGPDSLSMTLTDSVQVFDLLSLQDDSTIVLVDTTLSEGVYSQLRLIVGDEALVYFNDGSTQDLTIPSGSQSGIKILLGDVALTSSLDTLSLLLDFDATNSFVEAGQSGKLLFKPVIKVKKSDKSGQNLGLEFD